jgi:hypothetical protein
MELAMGGPDIRLRDEDNNLIDQLPEQQIKFGTSVSESAVVDLNSDGNPATTIPISPNDINLMSGGQNLIRSVSFSGDIGDIPKPTSTSLLSSIIDQSPKFLFSSHDIQTTFISSILLCNLSSKSFCFQSLHFFHLSSPSSSILSREYQILNGVFNQSRYSKDSVSWL